MTVETATYVGQLNASLPPSGDPMSEGDDHIRLIKAVLQATFPSTTGPFSSTAQSITLATASAMPLELISTSGDALEGPILGIFRNSPTPADGDVIGSIHFDAANTALAKKTYALITAGIIDEGTASEDGVFNFGVVTAGTLAMELGLHGTALYPVTTAGLDLGGASNRFGTAFINTLNAAAGGTLGDAAADVVMVKGTTVSASVSGLFDATTVANFGQEILDSLLTIATPVGTDQMVFRDLGAGPDYRYNNITAIVSAGLLGLPNI